MSDRRSGPIGLYVHIPFCATKCPYCDFNTYAGIEAMMPAYTAALAAEIKLWGETLGRPAVRSVFFGGGTPSYIPADGVGELMDTVRRSFRVAPQAEVTLEANPDDIRGSRPSAWLSHGTNRLSIGVQSFDDRLLAMLGRRHSSADATDAYRTAVEAGFSNVSIDLMYGLPGQTLGEWRRTLDRANELAPRHVSLYCLTLERGTPMETWASSGRIAEPDPDLAADMYLAAQEVMRREGYRHYEISNWAKPGFESRHNLVYWNNRPYLGVGPGAHSYLDGFRFSNVRSPADYVRRLNSGVDGRERPSRLTADSLGRMPAVDGIEPIGQRLEMAETMMMGLRLDTGIDTGEFSSRFGSTPEAEYGPTLGTLAGQGLLADDGRAIRLTPRGRLLGNEVFSRFFEDLSEDRALSPEGRGEASVKVAVRVDHSAPPDPSPRSG